MDALRPSDTTIFNSFFVQKLGPSKNKRKNQNKDNKNHTKSIESPQREMFGLFGTISIRLSIVWIRWTIESTTFRTRTAIHPQVQIV